jgi:hypothetical protein
MLIYGGCRNGSINATMQLNVSSSDHSPSQLTNFVEQSLQNDTASTDGELQRAVGAPVTIWELVCVTGCNLALADQSQSKIFAMSSGG